MSDKAQRGNKLTRKRFSRGGGSAPFLRGRSGADNIKAPRGEGGWKDMVKAEAKLPKLKSEYKLKNELKKIQKTPDKQFKSHNPETVKWKSDRPGRSKVVEVRKKTPVKGSLGKKTYKSDLTKYHRAHKKMGLIKD